jgi:hypothetical protein
MAEGTKPAPYRMRFRVPLTVIPPVAGICVAIPLWYTRATLDFFTAATHVLAIGAVGLALTGRFFRLGIHRDSGLAGAYVILNVLGVLAFTAVGLFFAFRALANGHASTGDTALVAASLVSGILAFGVQALFGTPGLEDDESDIP